MIIQHGSSGPSPEGSGDSAGRYHLFADETGQQSRGEYFLVGAVIVNTAEVEDLRSRIVTLEATSGRSGHKWSNSTMKQKLTFLDAVQPLLARVRPLYFRWCGEGVLYGEWTADMLVSAAEQRDAAGNYTVVVDGTVSPRVRASFRARGIKCGKVRGGRDQSEPLLRLADFVAGFAADHHRQRPYSQKYWERLGALFQAV